MPLALVDDVQALLKTERFGHAMRGFEEVDSTNARAAAWARDGAPEGSTVVTEYQTAGRGRHGRSWDARAGQNLMASVVLRPSLPPDQLGRVMIATSVAVAEAIEAFVSPHPAAIKWPNDVLLEGRKCCGMLLEASFGQRRAEAGPPQFVILGVGLNVNQADFPPALEETATSLRLVAGRTLPRSALFARLLERLERRYDELQGGADETVRAAYVERMQAVGHATTLRFAGTDRYVSGTVRGITAEGALRLETDDGLQTLHAGEVTSH